MNTEDDLKKAHALIRAKRYADARAILMTVDHPTADKWLERLNDLDRPPTVEAAPQSFTGKFVLTIVLLFVFVIPGVIASAVFAQEAREAQKRAGHQLPGADALIALNLFIFFVFVVVVLVGIALIVLPRP